MEQLILNIKRKDKLPFLKELLKRMEFVEVVEPSKTKRNRKKEILDGIEESVRFVKEYEKGKVKAKPFQQLLNEL
ncbi:MAG: hypothetical protein ABJA71_12635 [Ginsengibacter sp.]